MKNRLETASDKDKSTFTIFNLYLMKKSSNEVQDLIANFKLDVSHKKMKKVNFFWGREQ